MARLIQLRTAQTKRRFSPDRRPPHEVLGLPDAEGPSARGNSTFRRMRLCPREHALASVARLRRVGDHEALSVGGAFHFALETLYRTVQRAQQQLITTSKAFGDVELHRLPVAQQKMLTSAGWAEGEAAAWAAIEPMRTEPDYEDTYAELERMLASYFDRYRREDPWLVIAVEETLEFWVKRDDATDFGYTARLDLIVEDVTTHRTFVVEHKSAQTVTDDLIDGYQLDQQVLGQAWLFRNCVDARQYPPFGGVIVNITTKHKLPRHERVYVLPSQYHLRAFEESIVAWNSLEKEFERRGWPKALGNCAGPARYWSRCDFFNVCHGYPELTVAELGQLVDPPIGYRYATSEDDESKGED